MLFQSHIDEQTNAQKSSLPIKHNPSDDMPLHDGEGDMTLGRINDCSMLLPIYNICCVVASWRWWWVVLTRTINGVMRMRHVVTAF
jgi:hypothetical protein